MFERFTDKARKVVILAKHKATEHGDAEIRPVHMLYGLAATDGVAARALTGLGVDAAAVERELGNGSPGGAAVPDAQPAGGDAEALAAIGIDLDEIKRKIEESFGPGALERVPLTRQGPLNWTGRLPLNDQAKLSLALSLKEARACTTTTSVPSTCCSACCAPPSATRAASSPPLRSPTWAWIRPRPGTGCWPR